jgi:dipeptidyl aminopeptidase/acylaminoacyl peptidase
LKSKTRGDAHWFRCAMLVALMPCGLVATAAPAAAPPPADDFARRPAVSHVDVSPSGKHLALVMTTTSGRKQVAVVNLAPLDSAKLVAGFTDADIESVWWVNDNRLVFRVVDYATTVDSLGVWALYAVNRDGSGLRQLVADSHGPKTIGSNIVPRILPWNWDFHDTLDDGSPDIIVSEARYDSKNDLRGLLLSRLNTVTGERRSLSLGVPDGAVRWLLDGSGQPRVVTTSLQGRTTVHWRAAADAPWTPLAEFPTYESKGFAPSFIDAQGQLYVRSAQGRDTAALYRFDVEKKTMEAEPVISLKGFDLNPVLVLDRASQQLLGLHFVTEHGGSHWFDKDLRQVQQELDAALPEGRVNRLWCGRCVGARYFVVESSSDQHPGEYYLFDRQALQLQRIAAARPWIDEATQGRRSYHQVPARDGLPLPVYLTRPASAPAGKALPAVVLVHGGPYMRGHHLGWNDEAQFLASRGYQVIEVDYRGSTGYGLKHYLGGHRQWGLAMQDDLADAVAWAAGQGLVDAGRVCIMGGSYGGYAALMGPIRHPEAYRCAISFAGVTDIDLMYSISWSDFSQNWKRYGMPLLVGDREADAEQLANTSPLKQVHRIKVPVLLGHGGLDRRVPIDHARKFRSAAEKAGVQVEWVSYPGEGHGFLSHTNQADYWKRVEAFLARVLKDKASAP